MQTDLFYDTIPSFGMFTEQGNKAVHTIVLRSKLLGMHWLEVYQQLVGLSSVEGCEEATDTEVREAVYMAMGYNDNEKYYGA
jgi:hypothetical protein